MYVNIKRKTRFVKMMARMGVNIKKFRTDGGTEYNRAKQYAEDQGIQ
jgi:hypothetical protein